MKILVDARLYGLEHAGLGRYTLNLIEELKKQGAEEQFVVLLRKKYFNKLKFPNNWKKVLADFRHYSYTEQIMLPILLYQERADIVHFPHFNIPVLYFGKYIVTVHDLLMHKFVGGAVTTLPFPFYQIRRIGYNIAFYKAMKFSRKIIVPTNYVKNDVVKRYSMNPNKVVVTYEGIWGINSSQLANNNVLKKYSIDRHYFIYVGNAYPHKNLESAIDAVTKLNEGSSDKVLLAIAGSRDVFKDRLKKYIEKRNADKYVRLVGYVPDEDLGVLLKRSIAFIYPSLSEGFGLQGLESMAAGTLVISSDIPVFREIYRDNVVYFDPYDVDSIADAMKTVMSMPSKKREQMINTGKKFIKRYSWSKMTKQTLDVYNEVGILKG
jgi:glycosyltransferase involved in cell wall biosynthesis